MCLGIPGEVIAITDAEHHLATAEVAGVRRTINIGLLVEEGVGSGDWVLIHVGFAMSRIDEREAQLAMDSLRMMGQAYTDEISAMAGSQIT